MNITFSCVNTIQNNKSHNAISTKELYYLQQIVYFNGLIYLKKYI